MKSIPLFLLLSMLSCGKKTAPPIPEPVENKDTVIQETKVETKVNPSNDEPDSTYIISLSNMSITISEGAFWEDKDNFPILPEADTLHIVLELGGVIEGEFMKVESNQLTQITVEECFETSVSLSFEGPHCDMIGWKHYVSPWKKLIADKNGEVFIDTISAKDRERFPKVSAKEFKEAIINHCGKEALDDFKGKFDVRTYPAWVGLSRIFFRISGIDKTTQQPNTRILVVWVPMGC